MGKHKIVVCGTFLDYGGYAYSSRSYVKGLINRGWNTRIEVINGTQDIPTEELEYFNSLRKFDPEGKPVPIMEPDVVKIVAHLPLRNVPKFRHNIIYTMMESLKVNPTFVKNCNAFYKTCWTPTKYNADVFEEYGMRIPIKILPIGIDELFKNKEMVLSNFSMNYHVFAKQPCPLQPEGFKFISVFRWSFRKGFDLLIKSFLREFKRSDNVSLVICSRHAAMSHDPRFYEYVQNDMARVIEESKQEEDHAPIYWCKDVVPFEFLPSMYSIGDCFVSCSRGEGFAIPILEASRTGLPVIVPFHTAFTDYATEENCFKYEVDEWVQCNTEPEWRRGGWITADFMGQMFPKFGDTVIDNVGSLMRHVKNNPEKARLRNQKLIEFIDENYSWDKCINKAEEYLDEIA